MSEQFRSKYEQRIWQDARRRKLVIAYEPDKFRYARKVHRGFCGNCGGNAVCKHAEYTPDFRLNEGLYIEAKGKFDAKSRRKIEEFIQQRPDVELRLLFGSDNWCTKRHVRRYSAWCSERNLKYAIGDRIPQEWVTESEGICRPSSEAATLPAAPKRNRVHRRG